MMSRPTGDTRALAGFSLVELMATVAIATILVSLAVAGYGVQIKKSRRTDARTAVLDLAGREEQIFSTTNNYTPTLATLGYNSAVVGSGYYTVTACVPTGACDGSSTTTFTISAVPVAGTTQAQDSQCQYFSVDSTGKQFASDNSSGGGNDTTSTCWQ